MLNFKDMENFNIDDVKDKIGETLLNMSGDECKAAMYGLVIGMGLMSEICDMEAYIIELEEEVAKLKKPKNTKKLIEKIEGYFKNICIEFENGEDADDIVEALEDTIKKAGLVTVTELYKIAGIKSTPINSGNCYWDDLTDARIILDEVSNRYILSMPPAKLILPK